MPLLPNFTFASRVTPETGRQDKVEIQIGAWAVLGDSEEDIRHFYTRLGAPPPVNRRSRRREDHGRAYGWLFGRVDDSEWQGTKTLRVRRDALTIEAAGNQPPQIIPPPLFADSCIWKARRIDGPALPIQTTAKLDLTINPTRFVRHQPTQRPLPQGLQEQELGLPPYGEASYDRNDNWLPQSGRLFSYAKPERWREHVFRYLTMIETAFASEIGRVASLLLMPTPVRSSDRYSVGFVETYWEWLSDDPLKVVHDLQRPLRAFSRRRGIARTYDCDLAREDQHDFITISVETAPGETLKIYSKTNQRIRVEVTHRLNGSTPFQFPREVGDDGEVHRSRAHVFTSKSGVLNFFDRLRERAAEIVNAVMAHFEGQAYLPESQISGFYLLAKITHAVKDFPTARSLASTLVNIGRISAGGIDERSAQGIRALTLHGVIERTRRNTYVVTGPYRRALETLHMHANAPLLIYGRRRLNS